MEKQDMAASDTAKTKSSRRTVPLVLFGREGQEEKYRLCGRSDIKDYMGYVCVK